MAIQFGSAALPGIVLDPIKHGRWDLHTQTTKVSGLQGETSLNTLPAGRNIGFKMIVWNGFTLPQLMQTISTWEELIGNVEGLSIYDPTGALVFVFPTCELRPGELEKYRWDAIHGWWGLYDLSFRQLAKPQLVTPEVDVEDLITEATEDEGP